MALQVYRKAVKINVSQSSTTLGQIVNLMSSDCENLVMGSGLFQNFCKFNNPTNPAKPAKAT
jgi:hypothetical protein